MMTCVGEMADPAQHIALAHRFTDRTKEDFDVVDGHFYGSTMVDKSGPRKVCFLCLSHRPKVALNA